MSYDRIVGMDPRADWLFGSARHDFLPSDDLLIPFILGPATEAAASSIEDLQKPTNNGPFFLIPRLYGRRRRGGEHIVAYATKSFFDDVADGAVSEFHRVFRDAPKTILLGSPLPATSMPAWTAGMPPPETVAIEQQQREWPDDTVVMGIIDDGIAFAHERFRNGPGETRIEFFNRQGGPYAATNPLHLGLEITKAQIDALLQQVPPLDEEDIYRRTKLFEFGDGRHKAAMWRRAHGTHVLDVVAGADPADGRVNRPIIAVQLPYEITADSSLSDLRPHLLAAVDYIIDRAGSLTAATAATLPIVINFSYGMIASSHDGRSPLELALEQRLAGNPDRLRIVLPAGNNHLSRCAAELRFSAVGERATLAWRVQPDDRTDSLAEIWLPPCIGSTPTQPRVSLTITAPNGASGTVSESAGSQIELPGKGGYFSAKYAIHPSTLKGYFLLQMSPTERLDPSSGPRAPAGTWRLEFHNLALAPADCVNAWIQRDDSIYGYGQAGRQSHFDDADYIRFDAAGRPVESDPKVATTPIRRARLINGLACGDGTFVVGSYRRDSLTIAPYSAGGPLIAPGGTFKPDAVLVTEESRAHPGVIAAGSRSGSRVSMGGTSVAAPQAARWIADNFNTTTNVLPDRAAFRADVQLAEALLAPLPPQHSDRAGAGRRDLPISRLERRRPA